MAPSCNTRTREKRWKTSELGWWIVHSTLQPWAARLPRFLITAYAANASSPDVGSSRKTSVGFMTSSIPTEVRFFWPPEIPRIISSPMYVSAQSSRPRSTSIRSTIARFSSIDTDDGSRSIAENMIASRGVCVATSRSCCIT